MACQIPTRSPGHASAQPSGTRNTNLQESFHLHLGRSRPIVSALPVGLAATTSRTHPQPSSPVVTQSENFSLGILQWTIRFQQNATWSSGLSRPHPRQACHEAILGLSCKRRILYRARARLVPLLQACQDGHQEPGYLGHS